MTPKRNKTIALGTLAGGIALSGAAFAIAPMVSGYMQDNDAHEHASAAAHMKQMDTDGDGKLSKTEFAAAHGGKTDKFAAHDLDGDGFITVAEMDKAHAAMGQKKDAKASEGKCGEGKCGEGKCGGSAPAKPVANDAKAGEGKCGEGKCGEGKCGGSL